MTGAASTRVHVAVAAGAVLLACGLAFAGYVRWESLDGPPIARAPLPDVPAAVAATMTAPAIPLPDPCTGYKPVSDLVWPGKTVAMAFDGRETSLFDCSNGRELFSAAGTPRVEEGMLIVRDERLFLTVDRRLYGHGDTLFEHEPRMVENKYGRPRGDWMHHVAGRYAIAPGVDAAQFPLRELVLEEFGLYFARHGPQAVPPYPAGSYHYGRWDFLDHNDPSRIRLGDEEPQRIAAFAGRGAVTVGDVTLHLRMPAMRFVWRHAGGTFVERSGSWEEITPNGTYPWTEQRRTVDAVELWNDARECALRLTMTQGLVRCRGAEGWVVRWEGGWCAGRAGGSEAALYAE